MASSRRRCLRDNDQCILCSLIVPHEQSERQSRACDRPPTHKGSYVFQDLIRLSKFLYALKTKRSTLNTSHYHFPWNRSIWAVARRAKNIILCLVCSIFFFKTSLADRYHCDARQRSIFPHSDSPKRSISYGNSLCD